MKVIIHIGSHKTGTSFLQQFLFENRYLLKSHNILYPESILSGNNHGVFANLFKQPDKEQCKHNLEKLQKEINKFKPNILLISSECFLEGKAIASHFKALFQIPYNEIKIVCYLRPQFDWFTSLYNEIIRDPFRRFTGNVKDSREFLCQSYDYTNLIAPWVQAYSNDSIHILPYSTTSFSNCSLKDDFCIKILKLNELFLNSTVGKEDRINATLKPPYIHFLKKANQIPLSIFDYKRLVSELNQQSYLDKKKYSSLLSPDFFDKIKLLSKNTQLETYNINDFPISSWTKPDNGYSYSLNDEKKIMANLSMKTKKILTENASIYDGSLINHCELSEVSTNNKTRIEDVLKRQKFELLNIYKIGLPSLDYKNADELIIKQRIYLREHLLKNNIHN